MCHLRLIKPCKSDKQPSTRSRTKRGPAAQTTRPDPAMTTDATTAPHSNLPCDENGNVLLPLLGDEKASTASGNTPRNSLSPMERTMREYWTLTYEFGGDTIVAEILDPYTGEFRVLEHIDVTASATMPGHTPHAFLNRVKERKGKVISDENMHIVLDYDFDGSTRTEIEKFIVSLINHVTNIMFTSICSKQEFDEFVMEN